MLRPIDTQTIYQQTQEVASKQQLHHQAELAQQEQFARAMQKKVKEKEETVGKTPKDEKIDNDLEKNKKQQGYNHKGKRQASSGKKAEDVKVKKKPQKTDEGSSFDIRI